jgi:hypothetical protein
MKISEGWLHAYVDFCYDEYRIRGDIEYHEVKPWNGPAATCPSDLDYYGYKEFSWIDLNVSSACDPDDSRVKVDDLEDIGVPEDAVWEAIADAEEKIKGP